MPFAADYATQDLLDAAKRLADQYQCGLTLHQSNDPPSVKAALEKHGKRPIEYLKSIGVLGPNVLLAHLIGLDDNEVDAMARVCAGCPVRLACAAYAHGDVNAGFWAGQERGEPERLDLLEVLAVLEDGARASSRPAGAVA
jgi:cytosine/adenosine deaminase-related metal-dependent hydrolase